MLLQMKQERLIGSMTLKEQNNAESDNVAMQRRLVEGGRFGGLQGAEK